MSNYSVLFYLILKIAWSLCTDAVAQSPDEFTRYFAINMIYTKVKRDWNSTSPDYRHHLFLFLQTTLATCITENVKTSQKTFMNRLLLVFASVCCRMDGGFKIMYDSALLVMASDVCIGLQLLTELPVQLSELDMSRARRVQFEAELKVQVEVIASTVSEWCGRGMIVAGEELCALACFTKVTYARYVHMP